MSWLNQRISSRNPTSRPSTDRFLVTPQRHSSVICRSAKARAPPLLRDQQQGINDAARFVYAQLPGATSMLNTETADQAARQKIRPNAKRKLRALGQNEGHWRSDLPRILNLAADFQQKPKRPVRRGLSYARNSGRFPVGFSAGNSRHFPAEISRVFNPALVTSQCTSSSRAHHQRTSVCRQRSILPG